MKKTNNELIAEINLLRGNIQVMNRKNARLEAVLRSFRNEMRAAATRLTKFSKDTYSKRVNKRK